MVVRFVPSDESPEPRPDRERIDLAEVIDFRRRLTAVPPREQPAEKSTLIDEPPSAPRLLRALTQEAEFGEVETSPVGWEGATRAVVTQLSSFRARATPEHISLASAVDGGCIDSASAEPTRSTHEDAVRILARRALSSGELASELLRAGHTQLDTEIVIDEFCERLYLDDASLARTLAERLRERKGASRSHIRQKLRERKLSDAVISEVTAELDDAEEYQLLREAALDRARKLGGLDRTTAERRLVGYLARRGWSGEGLHRAVKEALDGNTRSSGVRFQS